MTDLKFNLLSHHILNEETMIAFLSKFLSHYEIMNFTSSTISFNVRHLEVRIKKISKKVRQEIKKASNKKTT